MVKRVRAASLPEFQLAASDGAVYGKYRNIDVYVELGQEGEYRQSDREEQNAQHQLFRNCIIYYAESEEAADNGIFVQQTFESIVIVYW